MNVQIERCWNGSKIYFRLTYHGYRETVIGDSWNRRTATNALNIFSSVYGLTRRNIRFQHR